MKVIEFKNYDNLKENKKLNKKKVAILISIIAVILILTIIFAIYVANRDFRNFMDTYILQKNVRQDSLSYIDLEESESRHIYAFDKYVVLLDKNKLTEYNSSGEIQSELEVKVSNPLFDSAANYLVVAEQGKQKAYLLQGNKIVWEKDLEGTVNRITVNDHGYVSVILGGTTYKSVIVTFDNTGKELFKTYLSSTIVTNLTISKDNKFLSFAEIDTSGALINCKVKTVSIAEAKTSPTNSIINTYEMPLDTLIVNIEYQEKNKLLCMCNDSIYLLENGNSEKIIEYKNGISKTSFSGIKLNSYIYKVEEIIYGPLNQASNVEIINTSSKKVNLYTFNSVAKEIYSSEGVIAINLGNEVHFIGTNGWLIKKYISNQEVKSIVLSGSIAGIIYRDKVEFLKL